MINFSIISKIVYYLLILSFGMLIYLKIIAPLLLQLYKDFLQNKQKSNKKRPSLDSLIESQKLLLRKGQHIESQTLSRNKQSFFSLRFGELSSKKERTPKEEQEFLSLKNQIKLFTQVDWGLNTEASKALKELEKKIRSPIPEQFMSKSIKSLEFIDEKYSILLKSPPFYDSLKDVMLLMTFFQFLFENKSFKDKIASDFFIGNLQFESFLALYLKENRTQKKLQYSTFKKYILELMVLKTEHQLPTILLYSFDEVYVHQRSYKESIDLFFDQLSFISRLIPIGQINSKMSDQELINTLKMNSWPSKDSLKTFRKKILSNYHPDKLCSSLDGEDFQRLTSQNFSLLNKAYDILEARIKSQKKTK